MRRLSGQVAIVTGGGSGIGRATCLLLAQEGAHVVAVDVVGERLRSVTKEISAQGGKATGVSCDLRSPPDIERMASTAMEQYDRIDILVNNAGVTFSGGLRETSEEEWDRLLDINLRAVYRCSRAVIPGMKKAGKGKIVNVASCQVFQAAPGLVAYSATKGAVGSLTRAMALDLIRENIFVNCVCPGATRTNIGRRAADAIPLREPVQAIPIGYRAEPEDVAKAILFMASADSDHVVGHLLVVDGGQLAVRYPLTSAWTQGQP